MDGMRTGVGWGLAVAFLTISGATWAQERTWLVGVGVESITPDPPTGQWLAGLGDPEDQRISVDAHDTITCRAMAISDGDTMIVLAVCDLIGLFYNDIQDIRREVTGVPPGNILIGCTHVHSAPDTLGLWGPADDRTGVDPHYLAFAKQQAVTAIQAAVDSLTPARLRFARAASPPQTSRNYNDPEIKDDEISILQAVAPDGGVIVTLTNWACHPEVLWTDNKRITADYVHYLRETVAEAQGGAVVSFNGALGGMVSPDDEDRHTFEEAERIGASVGAAINAALESATDVEPAAIRIARREFEIPMGNPGLEALLKIGVLNRGPDTPERAVRTEVAALQIGDSQWVTIPGEAFPAVGFLAKTMMDAPYKFLLGLTLDELGYILPEQGIDLRKYRYEQSMSINPQAASFILTQLDAALDEIKPER